MNPDRAQVLSMLREAYFLCKGITRNKIKKYKIREIRIPQTITQITGK